MTEPHKELKGGRYVLVKKLGEGSQGETYEAIDKGRAPKQKRLAVGDEVAIKLVDDWERYVREAKEKGGAKRPAPEAATVAIKCFRVRTAKAWKDVELAEREARTLASLDHGRLPKYFEHFEEDGVLYIVMEKIEGESLAALRKKQGALRPAEVIKLLEDAGDALDYLHAQSPLIVHRDIKPGNVIRRPDGSYAIVDFGSVRDRLKLTGGSTIVGTFGFMAPEQFQGRASPKSDVYGVGATALSMLTGEEPEDLPHEGLGIDVARAVPEGTPPALTRALAAMLVPDPDRRVSSVGEALAFLRPKPATPVPPPPRERAQKSRKEARAEKRADKRAERDRRKSARALARGRATPFVPRTIAHVGLFAALVVVWVTVGVVAPLVLTVLSLLFGGALRRAAAACVRAAGRSQAAIGRAAGWLSGYRPEPEPPKMRVLTDLDRVRAVTVAEAQAIAIAQAERHGEPADEWLEDQITTETQRWEEEERRKQRMLLHSRPPPKRRS